MIENEKIDCVDALIFGLNRTAQWRQKMAARYPSDPRNARAADCLAKLATDATALTDNDWIQLREIFLIVPRRVRLCSDGHSSPKWSVKLTLAHSISFCLKI